MAQVVITIATGFEEIEAVTLIDVMRRGGIDVTVASVEESLEVVGSHHIALKCDRGIEGIEADDIDMIVLPGGWGGTKVLAENETVQALLKAMDAKGKGIAAICAAPFALHQAGVLKAPYTCYPSVEERIDLKGYAGEEAKVVMAGNVMTSRGPNTAICFGLAIVKQLVGVDAYEELKTALLANDCEA